MSLAIYIIVDVMKRYPEIKITDFLCFLKCIFLVTMFLIFIDACLSRSSFDDSIQLFICQQVYLNKMH